LLSVLSDTNGIAVSMGKKWRLKLRSTPEVGSPHQRSRTMSAQTLTEAQEQGLRAEIIAARTRHELVTQQWVSSRAADIYRLGLYGNGAAPPAVSQEDDPLIQTAEPEPQRTWRTDEGSDSYWRMADELLAPIVEADGEEAEDAEFGSDDHGDSSGALGSGGSVGGWGSRCWWRTRSPLSGTLPRRSSNCGSSGTCPWRVTTT
jgi:hypothetical protein